MTPAPAPAKAGVYLHPPGRLSRWGVVDVGLKCVHRCRFCYYSYLDGSDDQFRGMQRAEFLPKAHVLELVDALARSGFIGFDVTGGEPCLSPAIVDIMARAHELGLAARIITLGQYLMRPMKGSSPDRPLIEALIDAGVADFLLSVHAVEQDDFARITGGSVPRLLAAMHRLDDLGFDYCTNTTVFAGNFRLLPAIARHLTTHRVYAANLIVMNAYYQWSRPDRGTDQVQGHYGELRPYLLEARDTLEAAGIAVNIRYAPLCTVKGAERNLVGITGVRHDPHEWMNRIDHTNPQPAAEMGRRLAMRDHDAGAPLVPGPTTPRAGEGWEGASSRPAAARCSRKSAGIAGRSRCATGSTRAISPNAAPASSNLTTNSAAICSTARGSPICRAMSSRPHPRATHAVR